MKTDSLLTDNLFRKDSILTIFKNNLQKVPDFSSLLAKLDYKFRAADLIVEALIHSSFSNESSVATSDNERLEFVGDAVIQLIVTSILITKYPNLAEGELSKFRSALVNSDALAKLGSLLKLQNCLLTGEGMKRQELASSLVANCFEAVIGAIYLDGGFIAATSSFDAILRFYEVKESEEFVQLSRLSEFDAKSRLQEECQQRFGELPEYVVNIKNDGFKVDLHVQGKKLLSKEGVSKKRIQQDIAKEIVKDGFSRLSEINKGV